VWKLAVEWSIPMITDQSPVFCLDGILAHDLWIDDGAAAAQGSTSSAPAGSAHASAEASLFTIVDPEIVRKNDDGEE
jgi:hypothetical protein